MSSAAVHAEVEQLLNSDLSDDELKANLQSLATDDLETFQAMADLWVPRLYERSPYVFGAFIVEHLTAKQSAVIEKLLPKLEADKQDTFFTQLYELVATPERWRSDVLHILERAKRNEALAAIQRRRGKWSIPDDEFLLALHKYNPALIEKYEFLSQIFDYYSPLTFSQITPRVLRKMKLSRDAVMIRWYWSNASRDQWHAEVGHLIAEGSSNIKADLEAIQPNNYAYELDSEIEDTLIEKFGDSAKQYLNLHSLRFFRKRVQALIHGEADNGVLLTKLTDLAHESGTWQKLRLTASAWVMVLYERDAERFWPFILNYLDKDTSCLGELLDRALHDGQHEFCRQVYAQTGNAELWNADVRRIAANPSLKPLLGELNRLDTQRRPRRANSFTIKIEDDAAAALYRTNPALTREFIWRFLPNQYDLNDKNYDYSALLTAVSEVHDEEFFIRLFRKVASSREWEAEMQRLLAQDVPPEHIVAELEKRKPVNPERANPAILGEFLKKYGTAVLPFLENYIDWTQPARLRTLLDLEIDRSALLRELQAIARRQPREFGQRADVWALPLYERSPEYFGTFITRSLTWESRDAARALLTKIEADGRDDLFRQLYPRFFSRETMWVEDVARLLRSPLNNEALNAVLMRRSEVSQSLPDALAADLYNRDPELFREFILAHLDTDEAYPKLRKLANKRDDTVLIQGAGGAKGDRKHQIDRILTRREPFETVAEELDKALSNWRAEPGMDALIRMVENYGDEAVSLIVKNGGALGWRMRQKADKFLDSIQSHISITSYWQMIFLLHQTDRWIKALQALVESPLTEAEFRAQLVQITPQGFFLVPPDEKLTVALYRRAPDAARPLLLRSMQELAVPALFDRAEQTDDQSFADFLTYRLLVDVHGLLAGSRHYQLRSSGKKHDQRYFDGAERALARLDRLYAAAPEDYLRHSAYILGLLQPFDLVAWGEKGRVASPSEGNRLWSALTGRYHRDWRASADTISQLLEAPNWHVLKFGLDLLAEDGRESASRILENLRAFRAILLSATLPRDIKFKVLAALEAAGSVDPDVAAQVIPLLHEALDFQARRSISDEIALALVRLNTVKVQEGVS